MKAKVVKATFTVGNDVIVDLDCGHQDMDDVSASDPIPNTNAMVGMERDCLACDFEDEGPTTPDAKVILRRCVWERSGTQEPEGFPTFNIEGTADGVAFRGSISLELDGRGMGLDINEEAMRVLEGGRDLELINAVYCSQAYRQATAVYHSAPPPEGMNAQDALNAIINHMEPVPPEEGQDPAIGVFIFRAGAEQIIVTAEGGQHGVDWNVISVQRA